jgi:Protein of unknown function (DUF4012)
VIYLEIAAVIVVVGLISVSDLIYRRTVRSSRSLRRSAPGGIHTRAAFLQRLPGGTRGTGAPNRAASNGLPPIRRDKQPQPAQGAGDVRQYVRVKLRSGRVVEGWRDAAIEKSSSSLEDAFDLDVAEAYDADGNPMSFPSHSFIVFSSQVERLDVLEPRPEPSRIAAADRQPTGSPLTASIAPATDISSRDAKRSELRPESPGSSETPESEDGREGLGRVIQLPEPEQVQVDSPAALLTPVPEHAAEARQSSPVVVTPPVAPASTRPSQVPATRRRTHPLLWIVAVASVLIIALLVDGLYTFFAVGHALESARGDLRRGAHALLAGHYQSAHAEFWNASTASGTADGLQGHPAFWVASHLPLLNRDPAALAALDHSSDLASQAGLDAVQAAHAMGAPTEGLAATIYSHGQVNLNASQRGEPYFVDIEDLLTRAYTVLRAAPPPFFGPVRDALSAAIEKVAEARDAVHKTRSLVQALPSLFGRDQTKNYLLVFDNPSVSRGSGGPVEFYGLMTARSGALTVGTVLPVDQLAPPAAPPGQAPLWFRKNYQATGSFRSWDQVTASPTFPAVAPIIQNFYEASTGTHVDGVIEMDPVAMGLMSKAVGSLHQANFGITVNYHNAVRVLTHDVYVHFGNNQHARDVYVAGLIQEVWRRISKGQATAAELATALGKASSGSHFTLFSSTPSDERALNQVGVGASFSTFQPNVQMAASNDDAHSRLGYYVHRKIDTVARLTRKGQAFVTTTIQVQNSAPKLPNHVLVNKEGTGLLQTDLSLIVPLQATVQDVSLAGKTQHYKVGAEGSNPRVSLPLKVPPGSSTTVKLSYLIPHAFDLSPSGGLFRFTSMPQATANPDSTTLTVIPPEGFPIVPTGSIGGRQDGNSYVAANSTGSLVQVTVKVAPKP